MAELARTLLGGPSLDAALPVAAERIASALELPSATLRRGEVADQPGRLSLPLTRDGNRLGTLVIPAGIAPENLAGLERATRPRARGAARRGDRPGPAAQGDGRDGGSAAQRRDQDGSAAHGLPRPADTDHRHPRRGRGAHLSDDRRGGSRRPPRSDRRRLRPARRPGRQPARSLPPADRHGGAIEGLVLDRGGGRGCDRRPRDRARPLPALDRRAPAVHPGRCRPARAGRSSTCSRTPRATPAESRCRSAPARSRAGS